MEKGQNIVIIRNRDVVAGRQRVRAPPPRSSTIQQFLRNFISVRQSIFSKECGKITDPSEARTHDPYSAAELSGRAFKPTPKAESFTRTAPLFYQLHRGTIAAPSQSAEDLKSERGLPTPGGPSQTHHWIGLKRKFKGNRIFKEN